MEFSDEDQASLGKISEHGRETDPLAVTDPHEWRNRHSGLSCSVVCTSCKQKYQRKNC
jgi:hypothetical protein